MKWLSNKTLVVNGARSFWMVLGVLFVPSFSYAQITVEQSGGANVSKEAADPTAIMLVGESASDKITIFNVLSQSDSIIAAAGTAGSSGSFMMTGGGHGQESQRLCDTPCRLTLQPGTYRFRIGENFFLSGTLDLDASGGEVAYRVEEGSLAGWVLGIVLTVLGAGITPVGFAVHPEFVVPGGLVMLGTGITIIATSAFGDAWSIPPSVASTQF